MRNKYYLLLAVVCILGLLSGCSKNSPSEEMAEEETAAVQRSKTISETEEGLPGLTSPAVSYSDFLYENYKGEQVNSILADLTHDGEDDLLVISTHESDSEQNGMPSEYSKETIIDVYTRSNGEIINIYSDSANSEVHPGYRWYYLYVEENRPYLVQYSPDFWSGIATYRYQVFSFDSKGEKIMLAEEQADYDSTHSDEAAKRNQADGLQQLIERAQPYRQIPLIELGEDILVNDPDMPAHYSYVIQCGKLATVKELSTVE